MTDYKIIEETEYYDMSKIKNPIGLVMMVKNEKKCLQGTLDSVVGHVDCMIIYDTGSTDNTLDIIQEHSKKHEINLYLIQGEFVDFSTSRNVVLNYADSKDADYLLLMDCNDILRGGDKLREYVKKQAKENTECEAYLTCQIWWSGREDKYYNLRFLRNHRSWFYKGSVHEWMTKFDKYGGKVVDKSKSARMPDNIVLFQDRTRDDDKTGKRFHRDKVLLLEEHKNNPKEPRTVFYLAQTCACLNHNEEAFKYYKMRSEMKGFWEENFHSYLKCGDLSQTMNRSWEECLGWYMKAIEHSDRAEPMIKIAEYYQKKKKWNLAFMFIQKACELSYPEHCILFVEKRDYDYKRWHLMGIIGYYANRFVDGKIGCLKAIEQNVYIDLDKSNLKFYTDREKKLEEGKLQTTKKEFIEMTVKELQKTNPKLGIKKLNSIANKKWKRRNK